MLNCIAPVVDKVVLVKAPCKDVPPWLGSFMHLLHRCTSPLHTNQKKTKEVQGSCGASCFSFSGPHSGNQGLFTSPTHPPTLQPGVGKSVTLPTQPNNLFSKAPPPTARPSKPAWHPGRVRLHAIHVRRLGTLSAVWTHVHWNEIGIHRLGEVSQLWFPTKAPGRRSIRVDAFHVGGIGRATHQAQDKSSGQSGQRESVYSHESNLPESN